MMWRKLVYYPFLFLTFAAIVCVGTRALELSAGCAVLYDPEAGRVLYGLNSGQESAIASTTKLMTAIVAYENSDPDDLVMVVREDTLVEGSSMYLQAGETLSAEDLLYGLLLMSGNDAALTLARHCAGDVDTFVSLMNEKSAETGACQYSF